MSLARKLSAEFIGTFVLVFGGCGSAVLAASFGVPVGTGVVNLGIAFAGVSLAFGLTVLCMAYAVGHISGGHFNPAVTLGLVAAGRASPLDAGPYILAQVAGAVAAAYVLFVIATGNAAADGAAVGVGGFATNGYGELSPGRYTLVAAALIEVVLTAVFVIIIVGATSAKAPKGFAPIAIGLALTLIHLVSIPVTNTSVNPARSTGVALFAEFPADASATALSQLWLFWAAPIVGGILGGLIGRLLQGPQEE
ncbi:MAG: aquaporin Z [Micropepsaceae bacterium]